MDISSVRINPTKTIDINILHPVTFEETDIVFTIVGQDSPEFKQKSNELLLEARQDKELDATNRQARLFAACVRFWTGMEMNGKEYAYSEDNAISLFSDPGYAWILDQVKGYISNRAEFLEDQKKS